MPDQSAAAKVLLEDEMSCSERIADSYLCAFPAEKQRRVDKGVRIDRAARTGLSDRGCARVLLRKIFAKNALTRGLAKAGRVVMDSCTWKDLGLFCGPASSPSQHMVAQLCYEEMTNMGRAAMAFMLANPIAEKKALRTRQGIIRLLVGNLKMRASLQGAFRKLKGIERSLFFL